MQAPTSNGDECVNMVKSVLTAEGYRVYGKNAVKVSNADPGRVWVRASKHTFIGVASALAGMEGWAVHQPDGLSDPETAVYLVEFPSAPSARSVTL